MIVWIVVTFLAVLIGYKLFFSAESTSNTVSTGLLDNKLGNTPASGPKPVVTAPLPPPHLTVDTSLKVTNPPRVASATATVGPEIITAFLAQSISKITRKAGHFAPETFPIRIAEYKAQVSEVATLIAYLGINNSSSADYQLVSNQHAFAVASSFIQDAHHFKQQVEKLDEVPALEGVKASMNELRSLLYNLHDALKPSENALQASTIVTDTLDEASREADEKIRQIYSKSLGGEISLISEQLFNLGFYLINSRNLFVLPNQPVTKGFFDFKTEFFPTFDAVKWQDYLVAKTLFELALKADPANTLAAIYREVACLNAAMRSDYADYDQEKIISHLKAIVATYPRHALGHIELAHAHASISQHTLAEQHAELALSIDRDSVYLQYSAMQLYQNIHEREKEAELRRSLSLDAYDTNNPRLYYTAAQGLTESSKFLMAFMQIENAIKYGKAEDYFYLRNSILDDLRRSLSSKEYESLGGEALIQQASVELELLGKREDKFTMDGFGFDNVFSLAFSPDYAFIDVLEKDAALPLRYQLAERKASIVLLDFNLTLAELVSLKIFSFPSTLNSGEYYFEGEGLPPTGCLYLRGLNTESLFKVS